MSWGRASSFTGRGPPPRAASTLRRVRSESAANTASSASSEYLTIRFSIQRSARAVKPSNKLTDGALARRGGRRRRHGPRLALHPGGEALDLGPVLRSGRDDDEVSARLARRGNEAAAERQHEPAFLDPAIDERAASQRN